jgi:carboxyl-terminal processing protease
LTRKGVTGSAGRRPGFVSGIVVGLAIGLAVAALVAVLGDAFGGEDNLADQARSTIEDSYWKPVDGDKLDQASVNGMVQDLRRRYDDRFSHYFPPDQLDEFNQATSGRFSGVGLTVSQVKEGLRVASVLPDTPAEKAGVKQGDVIVAVNGRSIAGEPAQVATAEIKGPTGTKVRLRIDPVGSGSPREVTLERADVRVPAVTGELREADGEKVGYIRFTTFSEGAHGELRDTAERLERRGAKGLVLDLRGNGGGLLNEAVLSSSVFVDKGRIVSTESRTQGDRKYDAVGDALAPKPTVILINGDTASAAEIFTSALSDHHLATTVGTTSFGKGVFQEVLDLAAGGALDLTVGEYFTADGTSLAGKGIKPDVRAEDNPRTAPDEGLEAGLDQLSSMLPGAK